MELTEVFPQYANQSFDGIWTSTQVYVPALDRIFYTMLGVKGIDEPCVITFDAFGNGVVN